MVSNIGKIYNYNKKTGVGYIVTKDDCYMFTIDDIEFPVEKIYNGKLVKFRGEKVYKYTKKAFFIKQISDILEKKESTK